MLKKFIEQAKKGQAVFITDAREAFAAMDPADKQSIICILTLVDKSQRLFDLSIPSPSALDKDQSDFVISYIRAEVYNTLSTLGGRSMTFYAKTSNKDVVGILESLNETFGTGQKRTARIGYAKCVNVIDRMLGALAEADTKFEFIIKDISEKPEIKETSTESSSGVEVFQRAAENLEGKAICGMDIGGTDIKVAMAFDSRLACLKEYDWFPEKFKTASQLNNPICLLIRLVRAKTSFDIAGGNDDLAEKLTQAMDKGASYELIEKTVAEAEAALSEKIIALDAIGLSFPDVVIKDKIVGGEATKTRGMRENPEIDYEKEFAIITNLDQQLLKLCKAGGVVKNTNDGPMAAYTAAVEIAGSAEAETVKNGVFAHSLGTELGTGWVDHTGNIPKLPLECYNLIIDLGDFVAKAYPADDVRSINNVNTGLAGTLQKYTSQGGVFRLGMKYFRQDKADLYQEIFDKNLIEERGDMLVVRTKPNDMRKAFLEHMMELTERPDGELAKEIFRQVGLFLAITWFETQRILKPKTAARTLFGRLVKRKVCFEMIKEGASTRIKNLQIDVADSTMANTSLMKQLEENPHFTVAQFAQAIGSIYYGNMGLQKDYIPNSR
ncbi:MAG: hypothetical protein K8R02_08415 [Anaerohalosphaeraceae bacterium]|nr:hypothetical protein [Anaerohalosphaeraceae bacterium]